MNLLYLENSIIGSLFRFFSPYFLLVCQTYVTPCLMKSWSVSLGDFHPSGRIGKQL